MEWLQYEDGYWIGVVLALTEVFKRIARVRDRWIPVVPIVVGLLVGAVIAWSQPWVDWGTFTRAAVQKGLVVGSMAMAFYKLFRTTVLGVGTDDERDGTRA